jgi:hypothetical protein
MPGVQVRKGGVAPDRIWPLPTQELGQVVAHQALELGSASVWPPESFLGKVPLEVEHLSPLIRLFAGLWGVGPLIEVHHDVWTPCPFPGLVAEAEFVLGAGLGVGHGRSEAFPKDSDEDIARLDA